jgi:hypothetical protein
MKIKELISNRSLTEITINDDEMESITKHFLIHLIGDSLFDFSNKEKFLKTLLTSLKNRKLNSDGILDIIRRARKEGYDYPEFKAIEKSIFSGKNK